MLFLLMTVEEKKRLLNIQLVEKACLILKENIKDIRYVNDWVQMLEVSETKLQKILKKHRLCTAKKFLKKIRFKHIKKVIRNNPQVTSYCVARETGLEDEKRLYKFLNRNFNTNFTELRLTILVTVSKSKA